MHIFRSIKKYLIAITSCIIVIGTIITVVMIFTISPRTDLTGTGNGTIELKNVASDSARGNAAGYTKVNTKVWGDFELHGDIATNKLKVVEGNGFELDQESGGIDLTHNQFHVILPSALTAATYKLSLTDGKHVSSTWDFVLEDDNTLNTISITNVQYSRNGSTPASVEGASFYCDRLYQISGNIVITPSEYENLNLGNIYLNDNTTELGFGELNITPSSAGSLSGTFVCNFTPFGYSAQTNCDLVLSGHNGYHTEIVDSNTISLAAFPAIADSLTLSSNDSDVSFPGPTEEAHTLNFSYDWTGDEPDTTTFQLTDSTNFINLSVNSTSQTITCDLKSGAGVDDYGAQIKYKTVGGQNYICSNSISIVVTQKEKPIYINPVEDGSNADKYYSNVNGEQVYNFLYQSNDASSDDVSPIWNVSNGNINISYNEVEDKDFNYAYIYTVTFPIYFVPTPIDDTTTGSEGFDLQLFFDGNSQADDSNPLSIIFSNNVLNFDDDIGEQKVNLRATVDTTINFNLVTSEGYDYYPAYTYSCTAATEIQNITKKINFTVDGTTGVSVEFIYCKDAYSYFETIPDEISFTIHIKNKSDDDNDIFTKNINIPTENIIVDNSVSIDQITKNYVTWENTSVEEPEYIEGLIKVKNADLREVNNWTLQCEPVNSSALKTTNSDDEPTFVLNSLYSPGDKGLSFEISFNNKSDGKEDLKFDISFIYSDGTITTQTNKKTITVKKAVFSDDGTDWMGYQPNDGKNISPIMCKQLTDTKTNGTAPPTAYVYNKYYDEEWKDELPFYNANNLEIPKWIDVGGREASVTNYCLLVGVNPNTFKGGDPDEQGFQPCVALRGTLTFSNALKTIGEYAFCCNSRLDGVFGDGEDSTPLYINSNITSIGKFAFAKLQYESLSIDFKNVKIIGEYAFARGEFAQFTVINITNAEDFMKTNDNDSDTKALTFIYDDGSSDWSGTVIIIGEYVVDYDTIFNTMKSYGLDDNWKLAQLSNI